MQKIAIHSVPRSGSTWLGSIFNSHPEIAYRYQPLFSYAFKGYLNDKSSSSRINTFYDSILKSKDSFLLQTEAIEKGLIPDFSKKNDVKAICYKEVRYHNILENLIQKSPTIKVVLIIRNPLAVLYSWKNAPKEFKADLGWKFIDEWRFAESKNKGLIEEYNGYEKWKEASKLFLYLKEKYLDNVMIVSYENLLNDTIGVTNKLFDFCGFDTPESTINFISQSKSKHSNDAYSIYKSKKSNDDDFLKLHKEIIEFVRKDLNNSELKVFLND